MSTSTYRINDYELPLSSVITLTNGKITTNKSLDANIDYKTVIINQMKMMLSTPKGSRIRDKNYGTTIYRYIGYQKTNENASIIKQLITNELTSNFRNSIRNLQSTVTPDTVNNTFDIKITFDVIHKRTKIFVADAIVTYQLK